MVDIRHRVRIDGDPGKIYAALTTQAGLAGWWTPETTVKGGKVGDAIEFRFGGRGGCDVAIENLKPERQVVWRVTKGPDDWVGTTIQFDLKTGDGEQALIFEHRDWKAPNDFMAHCSLRWAFFLLSLKLLIEKGQGQPVPLERKIWGDM